MAEAYRGLTIRIGGEVSGLSKALKSANSAIRATQSQLRNLSTALRLDPGNTKAAELQVGAIGTLAVDTASKLSTLKSAYEQVGAQIDPISGNSFAALAESTTDASYAANKALESYNKLTDKLATYYQQLTAISKDVGLGVVFNRDNSNMEDIISALDLFVESGRLTRAEADEIGRAISTLKAQWQDASKALNSAQTVEQLQSLGVQAVKTESELSHLASEFVSLTRQAGASKGLEDINARLQTLDVAANVARDRFERLDAAAKLNPGNIEIAAERTRALRDATDIARQRAELLKTALERMDARGVTATARSIGNLPLAAEKAANALKLAKLEVADLQAKYRDASLALDEFIRTNGYIDGSDYKELSAELDNIAEKYKEAQRAAASAEQNMQTVAACQEQDRLQAELIETEQFISNVGAKGSDTFSGLVGAAGVIATGLSSHLERAFNGARDAAAEVDAAYRDMRKTVDGTEYEYEALRRAAMDFSQTHVTSAEQILEIEALGGQFGIAVDQLQSFSEAISNLDVATDINAEDAALKVGQMVNVMKDFDQNEVSNFADALVRLGNNMPATESAMMNIAQRISSVASITEMTTPQVLGWSAALASTGQKSEAAATALANTMTQIESAVAARGEGLEKFAEIAGKSAEDFADAWETEPSEALKAFIEGLNDLDMADESVIARIEELGISSVRQEQALLGLASTVENLDSAMEMANDAWVNGGDAQEEARRKAEGLSGQLAIMNNTVQVLGAEFAEGFVPLVQLATGALTHLLEAVRDMPAWGKTAIIAVGGLGAAIGVVTPILSTFKSAWSTLLAKSGEGTLEATSKTVGFFTSKIAGLGTASTVALGAVGALGVLVGGYIVSEIVKANAHTEKFNSTLSSMRSTADGMTSTMRSGTYEIKGYGEAALTTKADVDGLLDSMRAHNDVIASARDSAADQIAQYDKAQEVLTKLAGQTDLTAQEQGELEWALALVNDQLGLNISAEDVMSGKYTDEEGNVHDLVEEIDRLIQKRKEEAEVQALTTAYGEAYKAQVEAQREANTAREHYNALLDDTIERMKNDPLMNTDGKTQSELEIMALGYSKALQDAAKDSEELDRVLREAEKATSDYSQMLGIATEIAAQADDAIGNFARDNETLKSAFEKSGQSIGPFLDGLREVGISTDDLNKLDLSDFVAHYDGTMSSILNYIAEYNQAHIEDKEGQVSVNDIELTDAEGNIAIWNGTTLVTQDGEVITHGVDFLETANGEMYLWNGTQLIEQNGTVSVDGLPFLREAVELKNSWNSGGLQTISGYARMAVDYVVNRYENRQAAGGYIPRHADGFIATRATMTNVGWIGEAGAEAYTGNSLVPLTNTKYSQPFIDLLADGVISKLGNINSGPTYQVYFNDVEVNSDDAFASAFQNLMYEAARKADM